MEHHFETLYSTNSNMYPYVKLVRVDCSQMTDGNSVIPSKLQTPPLSEQPTTAEKLLNSIGSQNVPELESDIESNNGSSFCDPIETPHFESDSEPIKEPESKSGKVVKKISPQKSVNASTDSPSASKTADSRSIDPDGKLKKFFQRNPYPKRTHVVDLVMFSKSR